MLLKCGRQLSVDPNKSLYNERQWGIFVASLEEKGYFQGLLEGSKGRQQLMASAREYFMHSSKMEATNEDIEDVL